MTENELSRDVALATLDEALRSGRVTAADPAGRELQELALALEADSPAVRDEFAREMDEWAAAGFPSAARPGAPAGAARPGFARGAASRLRRGRAGSRASLRDRAVEPGSRASLRDRALRLGRSSVPASLRTRVLAAGGAAVGLVVAVGVALSVLGGGEPAEPSGEGVATAPPPLESAPPDAALVAGGSNAAREATPTGPPGEALTMESSTATTVAPPPSDRLEPRERRRRIERSARLTLSAPDDRLESVADSIVQIVDRHRGFVLRSSVSSGDDSAAGGQFELRVPADSLDAALRDLSRVAHVRARSQAGQDVTPAFVSVGDRLASARAERLSLLRRLEAAQTDARARALRRALDRVSLRLSRLRRELRGLRERTDYVAVSVSLVEGGDGGSGSSGAGDALDDALGTLSGSLELVVRALGVLIPLGVAAGAAWLAARTVRRRRRERALM
ncbi:MAG TPA: DUF4349 domain-containing protein [Thermoleophilaceae bacterium]|jgi:hypothetical protein